MRSPYVPLPDLPHPSQQSELPGQPIYWGAEFSAATYDLELVQANTLATRFALRMATLGGVAIHDSGTAPQPKERTERPLIRGISGLGTGGGSTATGGFARNPPTEIYVDSSLIIPEEQQSSLPNRQLPLANSALDRANIAKIVAERPDGMSETQALALALDGVVRATIQKAAIKKLAFPTVEAWQASLATTILGAGTLITEAITATRAIANTIFDTPFDPGNFGTAAALYGGAFIYDSVLSWRKTGSLQLGRRQWSLSGNYDMPDRALLAVWAAKELTFVKYRPNTKAR